MRGHHAGHDAEYVVVASVYAYLSGGGARYGSVGEYELEGSVVDADITAGAGRLVLFRAESEGVYVDTVSGARLWCWKGCTWSK